MARNRKKMALYEVIGKSRYQNKKKTLEQIKPGEQKITDDSKQNLPPQKMEEKKLWPRKPKIVQFNLGRIELSVPFQVAITAGFVMIVVIAGVFRAGQFYEKNQNQVTSPAVETPEITIEEHQLADTGENTVPAVSETVEEPKTEEIVETPVLKNTGNNAIVIVQYGRKADLEPVKAFFDSRGIPTMIRQIGSNYFLTTRQKFENPARSGSDGYQVLQLVKRYGAQYKAPKGYESFGTKPFQDAYGKKFDN